MSEEDVRQMVRLVRQLKTIFGESGGTCKSACSERCVENGLGEFDKLHTGIIDKYIYLLVLPLPPPLHKSAYASKASAIHNLYFNFGVPSVFHDLLPSFFCPRLVPACQNYPRTHSGERISSLKSDPRVSAGDDDKFVIKITLRKLYLRSKGGKELIKVRASGTEEGKDRSDRGCVCV